MANETKWAVYEANVQSYRSNMLSSQSFLLAVGAILFDKPWHLIVCVAIIAFLQIWYIWFRVIYSRLKIVDYYKFDIGNKTLEFCNESIRLSKEAKGHATSFLTV